MFLGWKHARQLKKKIFWAGNTLDSRKRNVFELSIAVNGEKRTFFELPAARG